jgi:hypothetical protein
MREDLETTCRMQRDELARLLDTINPVAEQRITARMPAVVPIEDALDVETALASSPSFSIKFKPPTVSSRFYQSRAVIVVGSFTVTLAGGLALLIGL